MYGAIAGSIAEAFYGVPLLLRSECKGLVVNPFYPIAADKDIKKVV